MVRHSRTCKLGGFSFTKELVILKRDGKKGEGKKGEGLLEATTGFPIDQNTRQLMNRAARMTDGVFAIIQGDTEKTFVVILQVELAKAGWDAINSALDLFCANFRTIIKNVPDPVPTFELPPSANPSNRQMALAVYSNHRGAED